MAGWKPIKRREFVRRLRALGFDGPIRGTRHDFMVHGGRRQTIPSNSEYSVPQLRVLLRQVQAILGRAVKPEDWDAL
jgi:predicted RNA binding protein YcfA (HicA-like mRNA interferase family)